MNPEEEILYQAYLDTTGEEISQEKFIELLELDTLNTFNTIYNWNDEVESIIDGMLNDQQPISKEKPSSLDVEEKVETETSFDPMGGIKKIKSNYPILQRFEQTRRPEKTTIDNELFDDDFKPLSIDERTSIDKKTSEINQDKLVEDISEIQKKIEKTPAPIIQAAETIYQDESNELDPNNPSENIKAGLAGLSILEQDKILQSFDRSTMFNTKEETVTKSGIPTEDGRVISGSRRVTKIIQPYKEELNQAERELSGSIMLLNDVEKIKKIQDRAYQIVIEKAKDEKRALKWEESVEKEDSALDLISYFSRFGGGSVKSEYDKEIDLIKEAVKDKSNIANKKAALQQLRTQAISNDIERTFDKYNEVVNEVSLFKKDPNYRFYIQPGEETLTAKDGRLIPISVVEETNVAKENLIGLNELFKQENDKLTKIVDDAKDANTVFDITKRDYNDIKKFSVSLGLNTLDLAASTAYGAYKLARSPFDIAAEQTKNNLGIDPISDSYLAFSNWKYDVMNDYQKDVVFDNAFDSFTGFGKWLSQTTSQQIPIIVSMIATGGVSGAAAKAAGVTGSRLAAVQNISSSAMIGFSSMGSKISDMDYEEFEAGMKKYSAAEKLLKGTMYGVAEGTFAYFSTAPILNRGVNKLRGIGANDALNEISTGGANYLAQSVRKDILPETATEMFFEGLTTGSQNLIDGKPFFENMSETYVASGIFGLGMSGMPALYVAGSRDFSNNKQLKSIQDNQKKQNDLYKKNAELINLAAKGELDIDIDINKEVDQNNKMIEMYQSDIDEQQEIVTNNIKDKGMLPEAYNNYTKTLVDMANIRNDVLEISKDPNKTDTQKEIELEKLGEKYNSLAKARELYTDSKTFGSLYAALSGSSVLESSSSDRKKKFNEVTQKAKDNIIRAKGPDYKITQDDINTEAENLLIDEKAEQQLKLDKQQSEKLGHNFEEFQTKQEATSYIYTMFEEALETADNRLKEKLTIARDRTVNGINQGTVSGSSITLPSMDLDFVVRDNMKSNRRLATGTHENTHRITAKLFSSNPQAFENLGRQIISYLAFTKQDSALLKMKVDNANIEADGDFDFDEVISSFIELIAEDRVDLTKMDNFTAALGKTLNDGLLKASDNKFNIEFKGQDQILAYFTSFGKKLIAGDINMQDIKSLKGKVDLKGKVIELNETEAVALAASEARSETNEQLVEIINDPKSTRRQRSAAIDTLVADNEGLILTALGFNKDIGDINAKELLDIVVKDQFLVKDMLGKFDKDRAKFSTYVFNLLKRRKKEIYEAAGLDATKFQTESLDKEEARQIADAKRPDFDEDADTDTGRDLTPVEDLKIVTPELVDEVKDIVTRTLKRTALTKGVSTDAVLEDINKAIEKEITKVIKNKMGPITRNVLGFAPKQYIDFIRDEMMNIVGAMPTNVIKQKAKSKAWAEIFKLTEIGREDIKKVNPDTGKVTNYRKQIFKLETPDATKFQRYFTRGGYTTLIERQKSLIKPMAQQLARSELARLRRDKPFIQDLAQRTGMTDIQVTELFVDTVIKDIQSELDNTASEILQQDTVKFSKTLANASPQSMQTFIDALRSPTFRAMLANSFNDTNIKNPITSAIISYFRGKGLFEDLTDKQIGEIARQFGNVTVQRQAKAEAKKVDSNELAAIISEAFERTIENPNDYKIVELITGVSNVDFNKKSIASVNIGRQMALKLAIKIGREKFIKLFYLGLAGPDGLSGLEVPGTPKSLELTESDVTGLAGTARTGLFKNKADIFNNVINAKDANGNFLVGPSKGEIGNITSLGYMNSKIYEKKWYTKNKEWDKLDGNRKAQLEYVNKIAEDGNVNKKIYRETILSLAGELTPTEARWLVSVDSGSMYGALKASASLIGFPNLNKEQLQKSLNLKLNDPYVLEHMTPAKYMALITYKYLLDPSYKNKNDFNTELDNFNTIILPKGIDDILKAEGKQSAMGLKHKIGDSPFDTRYDEVLKVMQLVKIDGDIIGQSTTKFSETNNSRATQSFDANLVKDSEVKVSESNQNTGISVIETEILDRALRIARDPNAPIKKIRVFDFDDTLARSKSKVFYEMPDGSKGELNAEQFADEGTKLLEEGAKFDFTDFDIVREGKPGPLLEVAKKIQKARGTGDLFVLTARAPESEIAIKEFLSSLGLEVPIENITGLANSSGLAKSSWIVDKAAQGYNDFYFADDAIQNIEAVKRALNVIDVKSKVQQAKVKFSETVDQAMNDIIYQKTGIESFKEYSDVRAKSEGRGKRSFDLIPASAEDFGGLLYNLLGKGKVGDAQWEWMQENLIKPYNRGINDLTVAQNTLAADFKALKNSLEGIPNNLKQKAFGGFTFEDIVRINAWASQGINVQGLSKRDLKQVNQFVKENPEIDIFSKQLIAINKSDGYYYPGENWIAGTITTDMREGLRTTGRSKYLAQWNENIEQAFSTKNLNKLEAAFGSKYREALEDSIRRMKTGTNRGAAMGRIEARFLDYINNSIGGVMFLNARSAVLQTISSLNFIELTGDNNIFKAGKAFANQPQYWSDFMKLMNSDYLVDRRNGLKINVSESEIAESAKTSKNKAKAVIATLLKKGFVLTQIADSFAIATGGASYYRNKVNAYLKQGLSKADAEARAFEDFKAKSEESQQSSDPSKISQQQASTAGKVILAFANTPSQYSRIMKKAGLDIVNRRGDWKDNVSKILYYGALQNIIFTTLQSALFAVAFNDDEEEQQSFLEKYKGAKTINSMSDNILRGLGVGGAVVSTLKNIAVDIYDRSQKKRPEYADVALKLLDVSPPVDIKVSKFRQGMTTWEYGRKDPEAKDPFNINNPAYEAAAKVVASTTNVPLDRLYQKVENIKGALDDDNENWKRVAMGLGWPEWQLMSEKQREEDRKQRALKRKEASTRRYAYKPILDEEGYKKQKIKEDTEKYFKLKKSEQVRKLDSLGLSSKEIKSLKYEKDRVNKLLELM